MGSGRDDRAVAAALAVPLPDRLFLGGLRNLLAGATAVAHHGPYHRALARRTSRCGSSRATSSRIRPVSRPRSAARTGRPTAASVVGPRGRGYGQSVPRRAARAGAGQRAPPEHRHHPRHCPRDGDAQRIAAAKACVVWCPEANRHLYSATGGRRRLARRRGEDRLGERQPRLRRARSPFQPGRRAHGTDRLDDDLVEMATSGSAEVARLAAGGRKRAGPPISSRSIPWRRGWPAIGVPCAGDGGGAASLRRPAAPRRARSPLATRHRGWRRARAGRGAGPAAPPVSCAAIRPWPRCGGSAASSSTGRTTLAGLHSGGTSTLSRCSLLALP